MPFYNQGSRIRRGSGIPVDVHPGSPFNWKCRNNQSQGFSPGEQPYENSQLEAGRELAFVEDSDQEGQVLEPELADSYISAVQSLVPDCSTTVPTSSSIVPETPSTVQENPVVEQPSVQPCSTPPPYKPRKLKRKTIQKGSKAGKKSKKNPSLFSQTKKKIEDIDKKLNEYMKRIDSLKEKKSAMEKALSLFEQFE